MLLGAKRSREYELTENVGSGIEQNHKMGRTRKGRSSALSLADFARQTYLPARYSRDPPFAFLLSLRTNFLVTVSPEW